MIDMNYEARHNYLDSPTTSLEIPKQVFEPGKLYWLLNETKSYEKSKLLNAIIETALKNQFPVIIFTQYFLLEDIGLGLCAQTGNIPLDLLKSGWLTDNHWEQLTTAIAELHETNIHLRTTDKDIKSIKKQIELIQTTHGKLGFITMDIQFLMNLNLEILNCSLVDFLEWIAVEFEAPVIVFS